jgi:hypothetical protein
LRTFRASLRELTNDRCDIAVVQGDFEKLFTHGNFATECTAAGILQRFSSPYSHQQNGRIERFWRTMETQVAALLSHSKLPAYLWPYAVLNFVHCYNRQSSSTGSKTPFELLTGEVPDISHFRVWGCPVDTHLEKQAHPKFAPKTQPGFNLGPNSQTKDAYFVYYPQNHLILTTRHLGFDELARERAIFYQIRKAALQLNTPQPVFQPTHHASTTSTPSTPSPSRASPSSPVVPATVNVFSFPPPLPVTPPPAGPLPPTGSAAPRHTTVDAGSAARLPAAPTLAPARVTRARRSLANISEALPLPTGLSDGPNSNRENSRFIPITAQNDDFTMSHVVRNNTSRSNEKIVQYADCYNMTPEAFQIRTGTHPSIQIHGRNNVPQSSTPSLYDPTGVNTDVTWKELSEPDNVVPPALLQAAATAAPSQRSARAAARAEPADAAPAESPAIGLFATLTAADFPDPTSFPYLPFYTSNSISEFSFYSDILSKSPSGEAYCYADFVLPTGGTPRSVPEALRSVDKRHWRFALDAEYDQLVAANTWELVPRSEALNVISGKWVFKIKKNADGSIDRYKARWVARGFSQKHDIDYSETFAPVIRYSSVRLLLSLANIYGLHLYGADVQNAFARSRCQDRLYTAQPTNYAKTGPNGEALVCKLIMGLYGTKQAARDWHQTLRRKLISDSWTQFESDPGIYYRSGKHGPQYLGIYVDDIAHACSGPAAHDDFMVFCNSHFPTTTQGKLSWLLGMEIKRNFQKKTLSINQTQAILSFLEKNQMREPATRIVSPMAPDWKYGSSPATTDENKIKEYRSKVASILFFSNVTRPDLAYPVSMLSRHLANPNEACFAALHRLMQYLASTPTLGMAYNAPSDGTLQLEAYADASWGSDDIYKARSPHGYLIYFAGGLIDWTSTLQSVVALSSAEAEHIAAFHASRSISYYRELLTEFGLNQPNATILWEDN